MTLLLSVLRIRYVYPGSRILIFTHPGSRTSDTTIERSEKKLAVVPFFVSTNFTKFNIIYFFKFGPIFKEL
jgi:hypothetical protein